MRAVVIAVALLGSACNRVECGEGTFSDGSDCVGYDPSDKTPPITTISPDGVRTRDPLPGSVTLTVNEPARIYFSLDGSEPDPSVDPGHRDQATIANIAQGMTVTYFAIDAAGNREATRTARYESDTTGPAGVANMQVTLDGTTAHVTWTNPTDADYAGTVLARVHDIVDATPPAGMAVTAGTMLSSSLEVLAVGTMTSFDDPARPPGPVRYVAWTFDDLGNYGRAIAARAEVDVGTLAGRLVFDNNTLTITSPANIDLGGTTASLSGGTLTVTLSVKNNTSHYFGNPKIEISGVANASFANANGGADGRAFRTLGPNMLGAGATVTTDLVFAGATQPITIDLVLASHPTMLAGRLQPGNQLAMFDLGTGQELPALAMSAPGPGDRNGGRVRPAIVVGDHFIDVPTSHGIERFDLVTRTRTASVTLDVADKANIQALFSTGAELVAVVKSGGRRRSGPATLVKLDEGLHPLARLELPVDDNKGFMRPAISPDGAVLAVPLVGGIALVDLATFTLIDQNPATAELDTIPPGVSGIPRSVTFFGARDMLVLARDSGEAAVLRAAPEGYTTSVHKEPPNTKGWASALAPDGRVWVAYANGVRAYNPVTDSFDTIPYGHTPQGLGVLGSTTLVIRDDGGRGEHIDITQASGAITGTFSTPTNQGVRAHWLGIVP